jgi:DNA-directed RNA polymerase subunit RPC12/RpoP
MTRSRRPLDAAIPRSLLDSRGDVAVGAYANRVRWRRLLIAAFGVALIGGAAGMYWTLRPDAQHAADHYRIKLRCANEQCRYEDELTVPYTQTFPAICPVCGLMAVEQVWACRACGAQFTATARGNVVVCPQCKSTRVGSAAAAP